MLLVKKLKEDTKFCYSIGNLLHDKEVVDMGLIRTTIRCSRGDVSAKELPVGLGLHDYPQMIPPAMGDFFILIIFLLS